MSDGLDDEFQREHPHFDFSIFHPSDHWPWEARCKDFYGGWRYHIKVAWTYHRKPQVKWWLKRPLYFILCKLNIHDLETWYVRSKEAFITNCVYCEYRRPAYKSEKWELPESIR